MGCGTSSLKDVSTPVPMESHSSHVSHIRERLQKLKHDVKKTEGLLESNKPIGGDLSREEVEIKIGLARFFIETYEEELRRLGESP